MSDALSRTKRALDLIPFILEHQGIEFDELAKKFGISTETLYEDLNLIFCCGLPGYTPLELIDMNFDDGHVSVSNPQTLNSPRKLSKQELLRLHLGLSLCKDYSPSSLQNRIENLQVQISSLLQQASPIEVISDKEEIKLKAIVEAIANNSGISFKYSSANSDSTSNRKLLPRGINESLQYIYVEGQEENESNSKNFRLDRMSEIATIEINVPTLIPKPTEHSREYLVFVSSRAQSFLAENSSIIMESHIAADGYEVSLREVSENWLISEIFAYGGEVRVLEPKTIMAKVGLIAKNRLAVG